MALYIAGVCGVAYGLRQIIEAQSTAGAPIERVMISGGAGRLDLVRQLISDAISMPVAATDAKEPVLLGAAILRSVAAGMFHDVPTAMASMSRIGKIFYPAGGAVEKVHSARYRAFEQLQTLARQLRDGETEADEDDVRET